MTSRSEVHHANYYTIETSYKKGQIFFVEFYNVFFCEVKIEMNVTYNEWILVKFLRKSQKIFSGFFLKSLYVHCALRNKEHDLLEFQMLT